jgi:hypothetical protein
MGGFMTTPWGVLLFLGAFHGLNPAMGWLFAVALGLQEQRAGALWRALLSIGLGHTAAVAAAVAFGVVAGVALPADALRWPLAGILIGLGVHRLFRHGHLRYGSMRIGLVGLTIWSFPCTAAAISLSRRSSRGSCSGNSASDCCGRRGSISI